MDGPTSGTIRFVSVITNTGGQYDILTGKFVWHYPGLYVFYLHVLKRGQSEDAKCYIRKNGSYQVYAYTDAYTSKTSSVCLIQCSTQFDSQ